MDIFAGMLIGAALVVGVGCISMLILFGESMKH